MYRSLILTAGMLSLTTGAYAQGTPEVITPVKRATTFIQVEGSGWKGTCSGFVFKTDRDSAFVATNFHVLAGPDADRNVRRTPSGVLKLVKDSKVTAVFDSGTKLERSAKAIIQAIDAERDLALLKVTGVQDIPAALKYSPMKLYETMPLLSFGFPFGNALATSKGTAPAITVARATLSSFRNDEDGALSVIQIDGSINPGDSGGPVVDAKGQLVGVAVASVRNSQGIGLVVPAVELDRLCKGRMGELHVSTRKLANGKVAVKAEVGLIDPENAIRGVNFHYLLVKGKPAKVTRSETIARQIGVQKIKLTVEGGIATGEVILDKFDGEMLAQAIPEGGSTQSAASGIKNVNIAAAITIATSSEIGSKPPAGWKEYAPKDNSFTIWIPEKTKSMEERERVVPIAGQRCASPRSISKLRTA